jgi:CubicO group peptidase (beta-lactamase class C family)
MQPAQEFNVQQIRSFVVAWCTASLACASWANGDPPLTDYIGIYADAAGAQLEIVAGKDLFAVIDEAKYTLTRAGGDHFAARSGDRVLFTRADNGVVNGVAAQGKRQERIANQPSKAASDLAWPRPESPGTVSSYRYQAPPDLGDGIRTGAATAPGLGPAVLEQLVQGVLDGRWADVHGLLIHQHGRLVLEEYFYGYGPMRPHQMRSATKSVVSALAGVASTRPGATALDAPVATRLPYSAYANPDARKQSITMENLLTMRSGLACDDWDADSPGNESRLYEAPDWVKATLDLPMAEAPGQRARYCSGAVAVVGRLTEIAVGSPLPEFAHAELFGPLGIRRQDWRWNYQLTNQNREYSQIHLRPRDLLKLGLLYANGGQWEGRQIIPAAWVQASLKTQSDLGGNGYGYFWWRRALDIETPGGKRRVEFSAAQGNGGQRIILLPEYGLVMVFTGGDYNSGNAPPNRILSSLILPALLAQALH